MSNNNDHEERRRQREQARQAELRYRRKDELLQAAITVVEFGQPMAAALQWLRRQNISSAGIPVEDLQEIQDLLELATALRNLPQPAPQADWSRQLNTHMAGQAMVARTNGRNHSYERKPMIKSEPITKPRRQSPNGRHPVSGVRSETNHHRASKSLRPSFNLMNSLAVLLVFAFTVTGLGLYLAGPRNASAATLMEVSGQVEALSADGSWSVLIDGDRVQSGQRVRTGPASQATLVFFDGTRTSLEPNTDVTLAQVNGAWGGVLRVSLTQNAGHTRHSVVPLRGEHSAFTVLTPSGAASVHGTYFDVAVNSSGASRFGVETGQVLVSGEQGQAFLTAGQTTSVKVDGLVEDPAYQFSIQGTLDFVVGSTWIVDGVPFTVSEETNFVGFDAGGPQTNDEVLVTGRVNTGGEWVADNVEAAAQGENQAGEAATSTFTGELESNTGNAWQVAGWIVRVNGSTDIADEIAVGDPVRVTFRLLEDSRWLAVRIESLAEPGGEPEADTYDSSAPPELVFSPDEMQDAACDEGTVVLAGSLANLAGDAVSGVEFTAQVVKGETYVTSWEIAPGSFSEIAANSSVDFTANLTLNDAWEAAGDGEIKLRVFANVANFPGHIGSRLTVTVKNNCAEVVETEETPTSTPTATYTPTMTPTVELTPTVTLTPTITATPVITATPDITDTVVLPDANCTGAQPHPTGTRLAAQYFVTYEEIMGWFCQGFGFGEIELAYSLSWVSYNTPNYKTPAEIFAMKAGGMGWGEIKQFFETRGNPKHWATPPPTGTAEMNPNAQSTPRPNQRPGNQNVKPTKQPKPPKPSRP